MGERVPHPRDGRPVGNSARLLSAFVEDCRSELAKQLLLICTTGDGMKKAMTERFSVTFTTNDKRGFALQDQVFLHMSNCSLLLKLVITKGYGVRATTMEGQNAFAPTLCFV